MRNTRFIKVTDEEMGYDLDEAKLQAENSVMSHIDNVIPDSPVRRKFSIIYKGQGITKDNVDEFFDELKTFMKEKML